MTRRVLAVIGVLLVLVALLGAVGGFSREPSVALAAPSQTINLAIGQVLTVRCPGGQETVQFATGPAVVHCNPKASPSTTTTVPSPTTTAAPTTSTTVAQTSTTTVAPVTTTTRATTTTVAPTTTVAANRQAPVAALMPDSVFNQSAASFPVASNSASLVSNLVSQVDSKGTWLNTEPTYYAGPGTPLVPVTSRCAQFVGTQPGQVPAEVPLPTYLSLNGSSDDPLVVYSPSANLVYELWQADYSGGVLSGCWGGAAPLSSFDGVFPGTYGMSATSISYAATSITEDDVASGAINHAIAIELAYCNGTVYPANRGDCGGTSGAPAEGQWFRFAPGTVCGSACNNAFAYMVFEAIDTHGAVVSDQTQGSTVALVMEQGSDWNAEGHGGTDPITAALNGAQLYSVLYGLPWADLQAVDPSQ